MSNRNIILAAAGGAPSGPVDPFFNQTTLLLHGDGTNGAQNNTFLDSSTNTFTITRNGNATQGTFSPFSNADGEWSNYFDGTANGSLRADSSTDTNLSGDFTIQAWVYPTANGQSSNSEIISRGATTTLNGWHFGLFASTTQPFFGVNYAGSGSTVFTQSSTNIPLNQWTHLAVTRSGNTVVIYINGVADTTNTGFTGTPTVSGTEYVYVGRASYDTSNRQFTGYVSNASIIKGTAATTFNTTSPLATGTSGQSLLTCYLNRFVDANTATTAKALTVGSGASVQPFSPFAPSAAYSPSVNGGSAYFDGTGDYLALTPDASLDFGAGEFTFEAWIYPNTSTTTSNLTIIDTRPVSGSQDNFYYALVNSSGKFRFFATAALESLESTSVILPFQWTHVACARSGTTVRLFVNGVEEDSQTSSSNLNSSAFHIGAKTYSSSTIVPWNGYLSDIRLEASALYTGNFSIPTAPPDPTGSELCLLMQNAGIFDNTGKNNLETVGNAQIDTATKKYGTGSMEFDGTGDSLITVFKQDFVFGTGDFTIEYWYNSTATVASILHPSTTGSGYWSNFINTSTFWWQSSNQTTNLKSTSATSIIDGNWHHIAIVRASGTMNFYFDGIAQGSGTSDATNYSGSAGTLRIGSSGGYVSDLNGYIDDLRITKGARYTTTFTPPTAAFPDL